MAREVQREIWLADIRGEQQPPPQALTTSSLASQEQQLLGAGSSVVSCLLEGPVQLGPGSVLQHCHLRVRPERAGRGRAKLGGGGQGPECLGAVLGAALPTQDACLLPCQGPIHIGTGCFVSGLDAAQSEALHSLELHDLVLQGHHLQLHGAPSRAFTLVGRLDSWEVGACLPPITPIFRLWGALGSQPSSIPQGSLSARLRNRLRGGWGQELQQAFTSSSAALRWARWGFLSLFLGWKLKFREGDDPPWASEQLWWVGLEPGFCSKFQAPGAGALRLQGLTLCFRICLPLCPGPSSCPLLSSARSSGLTVHNPFLWPLQP